MISLGCLLQVFGAILSAIIGQQWANKHGYSGLLGFCGGFLIFCFLDILGFAIAGLFEERRKPKRSSDPFPWYCWPLVPFVLLVAMFVMVPIGIIALISIPLTLLYPDQHRHIFDDTGSPEEKARLARWRRAYRRLSIVGRVRHAIKRSKRLRRKRKRQLLATS